MHYVDECPHKDRCTTVCVCVCLRAHFKFFSFALTILCQSCTTVYYCWVVFLLLYVANKLQRPHLCACIVYLHYLLFEHTHASISARLCVSKRGMCGSVCSWWERDNKGGREREREMREVWELNGKTQCADVLVHAVSLASFLQYHRILWSFG